MLDINKFVIKVHVGIIAIRLYALKILRYLKEVLENSSAPAAFLPVEEDGVMILVPYFRRD